MVLGIYDLTRHAICRNYPIIGRLRFFFKFIRPNCASISSSRIMINSRTQRTLVYRGGKRDGRQAVRHPAGCLPNRL